MWSATWLALAYWLLFAPQCVHAVSTLIDHVIRITSDGPRFTFDGIGALSAGASSRLLVDYPEKERSEILDLLFLPHYGAALQVLKVEIGADTQSTDGSEATHMRTADEKADCTRGYEGWLVNEAKKRNPKIVVQGLEWGAPRWIGNGTFFSTDNIRYVVAWVQCMWDKFSVEVQYIGIWNESPWGGTQYVEQMRAALDKEKFTTKLVLLDAIGGVQEEFLDAYKTNDQFANLVDVVGLHYPCDVDGMPQLRTLLRERRSNTKLWASEEVSTVADWGGAGCWGRVINTNFVRMNMTSSIAWSLIWSAYPNLECFGNGLLYAFEPWSGHYEIRPPLLISAHTTYFTDVGWSYLSSSSATLPFGGSYVTLTDPTSHHVTIVLETLVGQCFYHAGCPPTVSPTAQTVVLQLNTRFVHVERLYVWTTNSTHALVQHPFIRVRADRHVHITLAPDTLLTLTTVPVTRTTLPKPPDHDEFPLPFLEEFNYIDGSTAPFFADQGGAFEVHKGVLQQRTWKQPIGWHAAAPPPFTLVGASNWTDIDVGVSVTFDDVVGVCVRVTRYQFFGVGGSIPEGYCAQLTQTTFSLILNDGTILAEQPVMPTDGWHRVRIRATKARISASLDDTVHLTVIDTTYPIGNIALTCSYSPCAYDSLAITTSQRDIDDQFLSPVTTQQHAAVQPLVHFSQLSFDYRSRSCDAQPRIAPRRSNFSGMVGFVFRVTKAVEVVAMGRWFVTQNAQIHNVTLFEAAPTVTRVSSEMSDDAALPKEVLTVALPMANSNMAGVRVTDEGWIVASLQQPFRLRANTTYYLLTVETSGLDAFFDRGLSVDAPNITPLGSVYVDLTGWHFNQDASAYGPVNLWVSSNGWHITTWHAVALLCIVLF
eukprot:GEMP01016345.1.p1 GENE.GEMP01016345.1~~GEMP01016345.1.p1  ORF type:complete len:878 (+),score=198.65 GEMP01016345.1:232-2865(+)